MENQLQFRISSGLKNIIGRDLITDDFVAIFELVKNSYDAHATKVLIEFENLNSSNAIIRITDNGKGMNYDDLINKWLFVAYSAKKDGTEDIDYRNKIQSKTFYAGAKGIGRFSCDKLGSKLLLITTRDEENSKTEQIQVDWENFEQDSKDEFINIGVTHNTLTNNPSEYESGTLLEISGIRNDSEWNYDKLIRLKNSLSKLINPFESNENRVFEIEIKAEEFLERDEKQESLNKKVNGPVTNNLLKILNQKTIKIRSEISGDGRKVKTEVSDNGIWLFTVITDNLNYPLLSDVFVELFYLNRSAKNNFTRTMGIRNTEYGSVFLYKNGIRVYPYGEPGSDPFELDKRQQARLGDRLGTQQLIGRIEIIGSNEDFKETTSRDGGLIKNQSYHQLLDYFIDVIEKLESFWLSIYKYGIDTRGYFESEDVEIKIIKSLLKIKGSDGPFEFDFNPDIISLITDTQNDNDNALTLINSIENIAIGTGNKEIISKIKKVKSTLDDALTIAEIAEEEIKEKEKEIREKETQNLFLKSVRSQDFDDLLSFMHHTGIYAQTINSYLKNISLKLSRNIDITKDDLTEIIRAISFEANKILNISEFATKANFRLKTEELEADIVNYLAEYISNILPSTNDKSLDITFQNNVNDPIIKKFKPIELNILIDNLVVNSRKAKANKLEIQLNEKNGKLTFQFKDNGQGINPKDIKRIFDFGYTTTDGSGLGLYHVNQIVNNLRGKIDVQNNTDKGVTFIITI
ncbi:sensor histidine kinase [Flagellimonas aequoris]|uniref:histidine kinase n=1 Tax=Flagellimonas aequoris TaxID=2306997 RepID=A0A418NB25_9FLAO|nr:sensor histidine kinase [Allomuricauda aequoris]RIV72642.1 ATP-binding protein [Allomuricauda aequoris]TXK05143.1 sensor histidine kinase [Allomuricauda aequoris]